MFQKFLHQSAAISWVVGTLTVNGVIAAIEISRIGQFDRLALGLMAMVLGLIMTLTLMGITWVAIKSFQEKKKRQFSFILASIIVPLLLFLFVLLRYENSITYWIFLSYAAAPFGALDSFNKEAEK